MEFKNEQPYNKRFQMSEREFKVSRSKLFDFKIEFENVFK
jgi:hypothetical protein